MTRILLILLAAISPVVPAQAEVFRFGLPATHEFRYELSVIRLALDNAPGDHRLEVIQLPVVSSNRWLEMLRQGYLGINVGVSGHDPGLADEFLPVTVPLTRGLLGYRLLVVKRERVDQLRDIHSLEDLRSLVIGSGVDWQENPILEGNGLTLELGHYENLWAMLERERFDIFHRGAQEVFDELQAPGRQSFSVLPDIALVFRFDYFLYVAGDRHDLQRILRQGLVNAYQNGSFMELFRSDPVIVQALERVDFNDREVIRLETPENRSAIERIPDKYWHPELLRP